MRRNLEQRIVTGVTLAGVLIASVALLPLPGLAVLFGLVVVISAWEWSGLAGLDHTAHRVLYLSAMALAMAGIYSYCELGTGPSLERVQPLVGLAGLWWAIALLWIKAYPASAALWGNRAMLSLMGMLVLLPAWLSAVFLLSYPHGVFMLLGMVILVAGADIGAYFAGHRFGRAKLAPSVSPGKSWEGFFGGQITVILLAVLGYQLLDLSHISLSAAVVIAVSCAIASVVGDLVESMVKRHRGVKDSGTLLPGHGGFLDRIDGITAAAPILSLGLILAGWVP